MACPSVSTLCRSLTIRANGPDAPGLIKGLERGLRGFVSTCPSALAILRVYRDNKNASKLLLYRLLLLDLINRSIERALRLVQRVYVEVVKRRHSRLPSIRNCSGVFFFGRSRATSRVLANHTFSQGIASAIIWTQPRRGKGRSHLRHSTRRERKRNGNGPGCPCSKERRCEGAMRGFVTTSDKVEAAFPLTETVWVRSDIDAVCSVVDVQRITVAGDREPFRSTSWKNKPPCPSRAKRMIAQVTRVMQPIPWDREDGALRGIGKPLAAVKR